HATALRSFSADLRTAGIDPATIEAKVLSDAAVMILQFTDPAAMAVRSGDEKEGRSLTDDIVRQAQKVAADTGIPYLKLVRHELTAAAGIEGEDPQAALRIADAALTLRDGCLALFEQSDRTLAFRIGIDCGLAMGSSIGEDPATFNLWGHAVQTAITMASSAQ